LEKKTDREFPASKELALNFKTLISEVIRNYRVRPTTLEAVRRGIENATLDVAMYLIRSMSSEPLMRIGAGFGLNRSSSVSSAVRRVKTNLQKDNKFKDRLEPIKNNILKGQS
jgi:chromosomal replication initiation ATPase DnaA